MRTRHPDAAPSLPASPDDIDIAAIGAAIRRHWSTLALAASLAGCVAFLGTQVMTPKFTSQAQIEIISKGVGNPFEPRREGVSAPDNVTVRMDKEAIGTHVRAMLSTDLALLAADDLDLALKPEFNRAMREQTLMRRVVNFFTVNARETDEDRVLTSYFEALRIYQVKETRGIVVEFSSSDAALSARAANRIVDLYREVLSHRAVMETIDARAKLSPQILKLATEVSEAEAAVTRFRGQSNIFDGGRERTGLNEQQLSELTADLTRAATARAEAEARAREAHEIALKGGGETLADVQKSQLVPRLIEQRVRAERQISELSATLLPAHPRMKQLNADLVGLNLQIDGEVDKIVMGLDREAKVTALREAGIRRRIDEAKARVVEAGGDDVHLRALESIAKSKRVEFERLQAQLEAARTTSDANAVPAEVQIVSRARPSNEKSSPKTGMIIAMAMVATSLLGLAVVIVHAMFKGARSGPAIAPQQRASPRLAPIAPAPARTRPAFGSLAALAHHICDMGAQRRGFRTMLATDIANAPIGGAPVELARQISRLGKQVILLDWSLDGIGIAAGAGLSPRRGLGEVLTGSATFEDVVAPLPGFGGHIITAGASLVAQPTARDRDSINMLLDALDEAYDHIIVTGGYAVLRDLFKTLEGAIDAGVVVATPHAQPGPGDFLGFDVADLHVIRYAGTQPVTTPAAVYSSTRPGQDEGRDLGMPV